MRIERNACACHCQFYLILILSSHKAGTILVNERQHTTNHLCVLLDHFGNLLWHLVDTKVPFMSGKSEGKVRERGEGGRRLQYEPPLVRANSSGRAQTAAAWARLHPSAGPTGLLLTAPESPAHIRLCVPRWACVFSIVANICIIF